MFNECSYSIWPHFDTKSELISIRSQVLHNFVCWYVKCVEKVPFRKSVHFMDLLIHLRSQAKVSGIVYIIAKCSGCGMLKYNCSLKLL